MNVFKSKYVVDVVLEYPHRIGKNAKEYLLENNVGYIGKVITTDAFALIYYQNINLIIVRQKFYFKKVIYFLKNFKTNETIGNLEFLQNIGECIFTIVNGSTYFFHKNINVKKLFVPYTWFLYRHILTDSVDTIIIDGKKNWSGLPDGSMVSTNIELILPQLIGLFIIEEGIRVFAENAG